MGVQSRKAGGQQGALGGIAHSSCLFDQGSRGGGAHEGRAGQGNPERGNSMCQGLKEFPSRAGEEEEEGWRRPRPREGARPAVLS